MQHVQNLKPAVRYQAKQRIAGKTQVLIWMQEELKAELDEVVRAEGFKNRSEALESLLRQSINKKGSRA